MHDLSFRERIFGPVLRSARHFWPNDRFLWPAARLVLNRAHCRVPCVVRTADGFRLHLSLAEYPDGSMYFGVYEVAVVRLFRRLLTPGETAIDVGGNIGYMALHMARLVGNAGRVHAFEPVPATADRFEQNLILNGFEAIVKLHRSAVGAAVGEADIHTFAERGASRHVLSSMKPLHGKHEKTPARVVSLDDEVDGPVRLIKIDIEGAEVDALRGARQTIARYRPHIIVENNPGALAAFGHSFADILKIVWETAPGGYEAVLFERAWPRDRIVPDGAAHVPVGNVWLRPLDKHPS